MYAEETRGNTGSPSGDHVQEEALFPLMVLLLIANVPPL
jgi:hypothetical protein